jgi:hypothetical protein
MFGGTTTGGLKFISSQGKLSRLMTEFWHRITKPKLKLQGFPGLNHEPPSRTSSTFTSTLKLDHTGRPPSIA